MEACLFTTDGDTVPENQAVVCYWCHVYLKASGSAPSAPKMTRYDDTTFRSHDPHGSVSSDEQSE